VTSSNYVTIWCDGLESEEEGCVAWTGGDAKTAAQARRGATREGWLCGLPGGRDLCPTHRPQKGSDRKWGDGR
jgi:hypothetical protein